MVQFYGNSQSRGNYITQALGPAAEGLGRLAGEQYRFHQNRGRLQEALGQLENLPPEQQNNPGILMKALAGIPGGEKIAGALVEHNTNQQKLQKQQQEQQVLAKAVQGEPVSSQEMASLSPENQIKLATVRAQLQKNKQKQDILSSVFGGQQGIQPKGQPAPPMGEGSPQQPGPLTPSQSPEGGRALELTDQQIAALSTVDPGLARILQDQKKNSPEVIREKASAQAQAQADIKYNQQLQETSKQHELKKQTLDRLEKLNQQGATGKPYEKLLEKAGLTALTSTGRREFAADVKNLITDVRSILGGQFSNFEFQTILNAYPSADFSKDANAAIIKNLKDFQDIKSKEVEFAQALKKQNGGKIPQDFQAQVNEMVRQYATSKAADIKQNTQKVMNEEYGITEGNTLMFDPKGEPLNVPSGEVERYKSMGASLP